MTTTPTTVRALRLLGSLWRPTLLVTLEISAKATELGPARA
jgi:hypothetical protein